MQLPRKVSERLVEKPLPNVFESCSVGSRSHILSELIYEGLEVLQFGVIRERIKRIRCSCIEFSAIFGIVRRPLILLVFVMT